MNYRRKLDVQAIKLNQDTNIIVSGYGVIKKKDTWVVFESGNTYFYDDQKFQELYCSTVKKE